jgi:hypothetical protein
MSNSETYGDFGLKSAFNQGVICERERILELLLDELCSARVVSLEDDDLCEHDEFTLSLIALIKGEQK